jgi:hypothetical protein
MKPIALILFSVTLVACSEQIDEKYPDLDAAKKAGAIERGWLPEWLPRTSREINASHDLDTNISTLMLRFSSGEGWTPPPSCSGASVADVPAAHGGRDWPSDVPPRFSTPRHAYLKCEGGTAFLAVNTHTGELYYWRPYGHQGPPASTLPTQ